MLTERLNSVHWTWMIFSEMFLAGIAAGLMMSAFWLALAGRRSSTTARMAKLLAFPIVLLVTVLLIVDLSRPERFWHMVIMSERYLPMTKPWSPISLGTWLIMAFTGVSFIAFLDALIGNRRRRAGSTLERGTLRLVLSALGALLGLSVAIYAGVLLTVTNIPGWADAPLIPAVYAASAPVTGIALLVLVQTLRGHTDADVLELAATNTWLICFWMAVTLLFIMTLLLSFNGEVKYFLSGWPLLAMLGAIVIGGVIPLIIRPRSPIARPSNLTMSSALVLLGGLLLRIGIVMGPQEWIH